MASQQDNDRLLQAYAILTAASVAVMISLHEVTFKIFGYVLQSPTLWLFFLGVVAVLYYVHYKSRNTFDIKELLIVCVAVIPGLVCNTVTLFATTTDLMDHEMINSHIVKVVNIKSYYTESTHEECDSDGENCVTVTECDVLHPEEWYIVAATGKTIYISEQNYANVYAYFGTRERQTKDSQPGQCSGDGRQFEVAWAGTDITNIPCSYWHRYINYVKATSNIYKLTGQTSDTPILPYYKIISNRFGPIEAERIRIDDPSIGIPPMFIEEVDDITDHTLTWLGPQKQANIGYYFTSQPVDHFHNIMQAWIRGKKNDILVVVGMKQYPQVDWVRISSWSEIGAAEFNVKLGKSIQRSGKLSSPELFVENVATHIKKYHERQPMEEYRYLLYQVKMGWQFWLAAALLGLLVIFPLVMYMHQN